MSTLSSLPFELDNTVTTRNAIIVADLLLVSCRFFS